MSITEELLDRISGYLRENGVTAGDRVQIGFSGGPDSTVLFFLMKQLQPEFHYSLQGLYVDHGIRPGKIIRKEIEGVEEIASKIGRPLVVEHIPPGEIENKARTEGRSIEDLAREYRYRIFKNKMGESAVTYTALGHNLDDNVETLIMRVFQGSGMEGLKGIPSSRDGFLRPLLSVERNLIEQCADENGLKPLLDETNNDLLYLRNRIRKELLPVAAQIFPGYRRSMVNLGRKMEAASDFINRGMKDRIYGFTADGALNVSVQEFKTYFPFERMKLLYESWDIWGEKPFDTLRYRTIESLLYLKDLPSGRILLSGGDYVLEQREGMIWWNRLVVLSKKSYLRVVSPGVVSIPGNLRLEVIADGGSPVKSDVWFENGRIHGPVVVRSRKPGDFINLSGGRKKIKKLYSEWKIPEKDRWQIPVVCDRKGIIAVLGEPFGYKNRVASVQRVQKSKAADNILILRAYME